MLPDSLADIPEAPRLYRRRNARLFFLPLTQIALIVLVCLLALRQEPWISLLTSWAVLNLSCILLLDVISPQSVINTIAYKFMERFNRVQSWRESHDKLLQFYSPYFPAFLSSYLRRLRWVLPTISCLSLCFLVLALSVLPGDKNAFGGPGLFLLMLFSAGLIPFQQLCANLVRQQLNRDVSLILIGYTVLMMGLSGYAFWQLGRNGGFSVGGAVVVGSLYSMVLISQRLYAGEQVLSEVIREISLSLLACPQPTLALADVPSLIGRKLKHDHVFLLRPLPNEQELQVIAAYGDQKQLEQTIPIQNSITGTAFSKCDAVVWNDVKACPYYHQVPGRANAAEIAVPIQHQGTVFGVLDVQFGKTGVYGPGDCRALQTIANVLGNALALEQRDKFFQQVLQLWEDLTNEAGTTLSERAVFELLAEFARQNLNVDVAIYYPLALTGYPIREPYTAGKLHFPQLLQPPGNDPTDYLIQLIKKWEPVFDADVHLLDFQTETDGRLPFAVREGVQAVCFVPVGTLRERLGALFLNFRHPVYFDTQFRFTILSLTQAAAKEIARIRYYDLFYRGFGRPDLNLHGLLGRYGLKRADHFFKSTWMLHTQCGASCGCLSDTCQLHELLHSVGRFLDEIRLAEYTIPPDFLKGSLVESIAAHRSSLPPRQDGRRPVIDVFIDAPVERESHWVKLILYRIIIEAVNNAVFHADAEWVQIEVRRSPYTLELSVVNQGEPLPVVSQEKRSRHGIFALLDICRQELGADANIIPDVSQPGTRVILTLPMLPL